MKSDFVGVKLLAGSAIVLSLWIRHWVKIGRWRFRGGSAVYRNKNPRLFMGIVAFSWAFVAMMVLALLLAFDHEVLRGGHGAPRDCVTNQLHALRN
jgi:hypothetical protein